MDNLWRILGCGCCAGTQWGGEEPRECRDCGGMGDIFLRPDGTAFQYPGGPIVGKRSVSDYARATPVGPGIPITGGNK